MRKELEDLPKFVAPDNQCINLATNENQFINWQPIINEEAMNVLNNLNLCYYGNSQHEGVIEAYSNYINVPKENIIVGSGLDNIIPLIINALVCESVVSLNPDFFRYKQNCLIYNKKHISIDIDENLEENVLNTLKNNDINLIIISNPNNPLGIIHSKTFIKEILNSTDAYVVIDEAYQEYTNESCIDLLDEHPNLIILRTLSKAWGLASLRVGFALASTSIIDYLKKVQGAFAMPDLTTHIATKALSKYDVLKETITKTKKERQDFINFLKQFNFDKVYDSHTNFVYIKDEKATKLKDELLKNNILVNGFSDGIRITIGNEHQMTLVKNTISGVME